MDRREARRGIIAALGVIEDNRDYLITVVQAAEASGDPILAGELRRHAEVLTDRIDKMYVWAGNL